MFTRRRRPRHPRPDDRGDAARQCPWSEDGDHLFQLEQVDGGPGRASLTVDRCRYCGELAFPDVARG